MRGKVAALIVFCATSLVAQTYDEAAFQAVMLPGDVTPAITNPTLSAIGSVWLDLVRGSAGQVISVYTRRSVSVNLADPSRDAQRPSLRRLVDTHMITEADF